MLYEFWNISFPKQVCYGKQKVIPRSLFTKRVRNYITLKKVATTKKISAEKNQKDGLLEALNHTRFERILLHNQRIENILSYFLCTYTFRSGVERATVANFMLELYWQIESSWILTASGPLMSVLLFKISLFYFIRLWMNLNIFLEFRVSIVLLLHNQQSFHLQFYFYYYIIVLFHIIAYILLVLVLWLIFRDL